MEAFYDRLQLVMDHLGLTQTELSNISKIPQPTISKWKRTGKTPGPGSLNKIAQATGCTVAWLRHGIEPPFPHMLPVSVTWPHQTSEERKIVDELLNKEQKNLTAVGMRCDLTKLIEILLEYASPAEICLLLEEWETKKRERGKR